jgi:lipopolysaccharide export system protein LptC
VLTLKNFFISLLLIFAVGLSAWSVIISHTDDNSGVLVNDPKKADSYMEEVTAMQYGANGKPTMQLITPKMVHYPEKDSTDIFAPHMTVYRKSPEPWYIESNFAKTTDGVKEILFWSNVTIHHPSDTENPATSLQTHVSQFE